MSDSFPDSGPLREFIEGEPAVYELPPDAPWRFMHVSSLVSWQYCDCPWWHRLPFAGRDAVSLPLAARGGGLATE